MPGAKRLLGYTVAWRAERLLVPQPYRPIERLPRWRVMTSEESSGEGVIPRRIVVLSFVPTAIPDPAWEQKTTLRWYDATAHGWCRIIAGDPAKREIRDLPSDAKREYSAHRC